jgi:RimJ/RimL family protein N-acetyltransferase
MLSGKQVVLRAWIPADLPALQALRNDVPLQRQLMAQPKGSSLEQVRAWLTTRSQAADALFFVVAERASNQALGYVQLLDIDLFHGNGRLGICLAPQAQGRGCGGETLTLLASYVREVFALRKILLEVLANNDGAIRLYLRHNYREVGRWHRHFRQGDDYADVVIMESLLAP